MSSRVLGLPRLDLDIGTRSKTIQETLGSSFVRGLIEVVDGLDRRKSRRPGSGERMCGKVSTEREIRGWLEGYRFRWKGVVGL